MKVDSFKQNKYTLYKLDSKGKIRVLNIWTEGADLVQTAGILGGNLVENRKTCKPMNVGKSNATTAEGQAIEESISKVTEKLKEDYFKTQYEAENTQVMLPMLAKDFKEHSHKINFSSDNVFVQPKLDGMRALGVTGPNATLTSRTGSPILTMPHIIEDLILLPEGHILDGELYVHGESFQANISLIKAYRPGLSEKIQYCVYDAVSDNSFTNRSPKQLIKDCKNIEHVTTVRLKFIEDLKLFHIENIGEGYEGSIVRWSDAPYKINGRSEHLLKYKDFIDITLPIIDIIPSSARPEWGQPVFELKGERFSSGMRYSHAERKEMLINKEQYIGKAAEIRFFEYTDGGLPRFPVMVGIRLDK